jgi:hypothetical protein
MRITYRGDKMDPTVGTVLVVGFPIILCLAIYAFGKFSVKPD